MANDFLIQIAQRERPGLVHDSATAAGWLNDQNGPVPHVADLPFKTPSLSCLAPASEVRERLEVLRANPKELPTADLVTFGARNRSPWVLDALSQRLTHGLLDWTGLRAELVNSGEKKRDFEPLLERITPTNLWSLRRVLASHHIDEEAERALLLYVADRVLAGESFDKTAIGALAVNLVGAGLDDHLRGLLRIYTADTYLRHALTVELEHPRFGGSHELLLARFNQIYRRFGLESVDLTGTGSTPFTRLRAEPAERVEAGPLVTVIMSCWSPGEELLLAVRSITDQSYQNWELIVTDDASPDKHGEILDQIAELDPRIRVVRNEINGGTYVRRNEALTLARGEFVTMQDSDDWSHPRRLELQVRDLVASPDRYANIVRNVRLTPDLSLYSERGMQLGVCEPAIMFRREAVLDKVGFFDDIRKAADREFRQRLEATTGVPVAEVGPEVPLVLMRADVGSLSGSDFRGVWVHPARIAYRSSMLRAHNLIKDGELSPIFPARQDKRNLDAPATLLGRPNSPSTFDVLLILDGRTRASRKHFLSEVVQEIEAALDSGLSVGVMHSDSLRGGREQGYFDAAMQQLVDEGGLHRVIDDQQVEAGTVVIRHAVAAQAHVAERRPVTAGRVVVIEDSAGGDKRGVTFAKADVTDVARAWFDAEPAWLISEPRTVPPTLESVVVDGDALHVTITYSSSSRADAVELWGSEAQPSALTVVEHDGQDATTREAFARASFPLDQIGTSPFEIRARINSYAYRLDIGVTQVLTSPAAQLLIRRPNQRMQLVAAETVPGRADRDEQWGEWLEASIKGARLSQDRIVFDIAAGEHAKLTEVVAIRDAFGVLRRREFALDEGPDNTLSASRTFDAIAGSRWQLFGLFQTPTGRVQYPLRFDRALRTEHAGGWRIRTLGDHVVHVVAPSRGGNS